MAELRDPTSRFSDRATDYVKFRPQYPLDAMRAALGSHGAEHRARVADVGAGTGISARLLARCGATVFAVEPNAAMRAAAEPDPSVTWIDGTAEATTLESRSVAVVVAAQAFHWFRPEPALREFSRILVPGGNVALLWNVRDETDPFTHEYSSIMRRHATDASVDKDLQLESLRQCAWFTGYEELRFEGVHQHLGPDALLGRAVSSSYAPKEGDAHRLLCEDLEEACRGAQDQDGCVTLRYQTLVVRASVRA
jgi:SAM-dependent methyltransferase